MNQVSFTLVSVCLLLLATIISSATIAGDLEASKLQSVPVVTSDVPIAAAPVVNPAPAENLGGGVITEHKNPDGSTVTVTRYNGPLPASTFHNQFGGLTNLHDNLQRSFYETQLLHQRSQQALNQALYSNFNNVFRNAFYTPAINPVFPQYFPTYSNAFSYPYRTFTTPNYGFYPGGFSPFSGFYNPYHG